MLLDIGVAIVISVAGVILYFSKNKTTKLICLAFIIVGAFLLIPF